MRYHDWTDEQLCVRRPGLVFGVCRWTADRLGISAIWVRLAVLLAGWWTSWWAVVAIYLAAAIALGRTRCFFTESAASTPMGRDVRHWTMRTSESLRSRLADFERRLDAAERRHRRGRT